MLRITPPANGLDRARPDTSSHVLGLPTNSGWRGGSVASAFCGSTGLVSFANTAYMTETNRTAGASKQSIKRPTRQLEMRST